MNDDIRFVTVSFPLSTNANHPQSTNGELRSGGAVQFTLVHKKESEVFSVIN